LDVVVMPNLPTVPELLGRTLDELDNARNALAEAAAWMRSDWEPVGSPLTGDQAAARSAVFDEVEASKAAIDRAKAAIHRALP
jgi:hypothetical protein